MGEDPGMEEGRSRYFEPLESYEPCGLSDPHESSAPYESAEPSGPLEPPGCPRKGMIDAGDYILINKLIRRTEMTSLTFHITMPASASTLFP